MPPHSQVQPSETQPVKGEASWGLGPQPHERATERGVVIHTGSFLESLGTQHWPT